jgi:hypothetical protein
MRPLLLALTLALVAVAKAAPTCNELLDAWSAAFGSVEQVLVEVTVTQGGVERAFEAVRLDRRSDGSLARTTVTRRGFRRPPGLGSAETDGDLGFDCANHSSPQRDASEVAMSIYDPNERASVREWTLRLELVGETWVPASLSARFEVQVLWFVVEGELMTRFSAWRFGGE